MTTHKHPEFHTVEIDLPLDVADELAAKAGSVDAAVVRALQEYLKTDHAQRDDAIRRVARRGVSPANIARIYAMTEETIQNIINT